MIVSLLILIAGLKTYVSPTNNLGGRAENDVAHAIVMHDLHFVAVAGFTIDIVGVPDGINNSLVKKHGYKLLPGISDTSDIRRNLAAYKYAEKYNAILMKHLISKSKR